MKTLHAACSAELNDGLESDLAECLHCYERESETTSLTSLPILYVFGSVSCAVHWNSNMSSKCLHRQNIGSGGRTFFLFGQA